MLVLVGDGNHARACRDILSQSLGSLYYLCDEENDDPLRLGGFEAIYDYPDARFHLAIGPSRARTRLARKLLNQGVRCFDVTSELAIYRSRDLGTGVFIGHRAYIGPGARVDDLAIVNTGAIIEHNCVIGKGAFVGPGAVLCGNVKVGPFAMIGAGSVVIPKIEIPSNARIAAGETVRHI